MFEQIAVGQSAQPLQMGGGLVHVGCIPARIIHED